MIMASRRQEEEMVTKLIFECSICRRVFKDPGVCNKCDVVLKAKAA